MINNTGNTFVTPVFNGSASLRDAAGQLIEHTVKAVNRKKTVDDAFFKELYSEMNALYHLDQAGASTGSAEKDLGPLPGTAVALLASLAIAWVLMVCIVLYQHYRKKNR